MLFGSILEAAALEAEDVAMVVVCFPKSGPHPDFEVELRNVCPKARSSICCRHSESKLLLLHYITTLPFSRVGSEWNRILESLNVYGSLAFMYQ